VKFTNTLYAICVVGPPGWEVDAGLATLLCEKKLFLLSRRKQKPDGVTFSRIVKEGCGSEAAVLAMVVVIICIIDCNMKSNDRLCGLVVRFPGYRSRGPSSIPSATRFCEK
jgi:hypothetical protein